MEVVLRHVIGYFLRELSLGSPEWLLLAAVNRTLRLAVPAFLFMTALVLGAGLLRGVRLGRWVRNPALRLLWPHLLFRYWDAGVFQPERLFQRLLWGRAYFLAGTLQFTLLPPLPSPPLEAPLEPPSPPLAVGLTLLVYFLNRRYRFLAYPGSFVHWYTPAIFLGLYLAAHLARLLPRLGVRRPAYLGLLPRGLWGSQSGGPGRGLQGGGFCGGLPEDCPACYVRQSPLPEAGRLQAPLLVLQAGNDPLTPHPGLPPPGRAGGDGAEGVPGGPYPGGPSPWAGLAFGPWGLALSWRTIRSSFPTSTMRWCRPWGPWWSGFFWPGFGLDRRRALPHSKACGQTLEGWPSG
ncbi:MAG: hypothetical protein ABWJ90_10115 [Thermus sp.]|uniref:hypothetical protein n=1 Tax=Thermus sp. TaxID=275 RepID=UPI00351B9897